jgi:HD-GYP domain-containing protein (c-di-GMP phosphodiesterase class II)
LGKKPSAPIRPSIWGIRWKLTFITVALIALTTLGTAAVVIANMNAFLLDSLVKRGATVALSAATPAGFSILAEDRLALDNLVAKIQRAHSDVAYMSIVDHEGVILAHSQLSAMGERFDALSDAAFLEKTERYSVTEGYRRSMHCYEITAPIRFAESRVGQVIVGIKAEALLAARRAARNKTLWIAALALALGTGGTLFVSSFMTAPIKRLSDGVSRVKSGGQQVEIKVTSHDELGQLTRSFNEMSKILHEQKKSLKNYARNLEDSYTSMVRILATALDARDRYTLGHSARVAWLSLQIGARLGLSREESKDLEMACFLHDIGKIKIPDVILTKAEQLDAEEQEVMQKHPIFGAEILSLSDSLHKYIPAVLHHHEWYNGQGYPYGLKGSDIHLYAQIVAIADSFDAMTSSRPYRRRRSKAAAVKEIQRYKGVQFSPRLVELFILSLDDFDEVEEIPLAGEAV